ncbi:hypothetical protein ScPMuIL_009089 [Solemya velum]
MASSVGHPGGPAQPPGTGQAAAQPQHLQDRDVDPISKFKLLMPRLKDALVTLMKTAGQTFHHNAVSDSALKSTDSTQQRFEKSLEEFYSICDQIEINLHLALEAAMQTGDAVKFTPIAQHITKGDTPQPDGQASFPQYLSTVKQQIHCAKEIHDMLENCAKQFGDKTSDIPR